MSTPPRTSTTPITGRVPYFNYHTPERRVQPQLALSLQLPQWWELPQDFEFFTQVGPYLLDSDLRSLPRTAPRESPSPIARMTSLELSQGAQGPRSPLPPPPERGLPRRRLGVTKTSTPGLGANSQVPPLTGAARTCVFLHSPGTGATGPLPETIRAPPRVPE